MDNCGIFPFKTDKNEGKVKEKKKAEIVTPSVKTEPKPIVNQEEKPKPAPK